MCVCVCVCVFVVSNDISLRLGAVEVSRDNYSIASSPETY